MTLINQLKEAFYYAPLSLIELRKNSTIWLFIYLMTGLAIFSVFTWAMLSNQDEIKSAFLSYLFPHSWHEIAEDLVNFLYESQAKSVLSNMILSGSLVVSSMFLFPIKEKYSAEFEKDAKYQNGKIKEYPLIVQAWEEVKLFLIYLTAQSVILWIGYYPYQWATWLSITLSYLFLLFPDLTRTLKPTKKTVIQSYSLMASILVIGLFLHTTLISSMHHKSQLLKAQYSVDWDSIEYDLPSLSQFFNGKALTNLSFNINIKNPTDFDIMIEKGKKTSELK